MSQAIKPKERDAVIQSLRAGVVPRIGQYLIQVGRTREIETLVADIQRLSDGGAAFRLITGEYGAGKTFFLNLVRAIALNKNLVVANADLNPDRRLHASGGQARSLYAELMRSLATRARPDGNALAGVVEKFISTARDEAKAKSKTTDAVIREKLNHLTELVNGYDFADVIASYCRGFEESNEQLKSDAIRWLRAEYSTKTEARQALGVRTIIEDDTIYDQLKLMGRFVRLAGYQGMLVCLDEMVNLYKLSNTQARKSNYEQILRILNDSLQGSSEGLGFLLGGTPEFLMDSRRGLYSYEALQSRLATNSFASNGLVDHKGPVIRLERLTAEDLYVLLQKVREVYASGDPAKYLIPDEGLHAFMQHCSKKLGEASFRTPRNTIRSFVDLLAILEQNPSATWQQLIGTVDVKPDNGAALEQAVDPDDDLASFKM